MVCSRQWSWQSRTKYWISKLNVLHINVVLKYRVLNSSRWKNSHERRKKRKTTTMQKNRHNKGRAEQNMFGAYERKTRLMIWRKIKKNKNQERKRENALSLILLQTNTLLEAFHARTACLTVQLSANLFSPTKRKRRKHHTNEYKMRAISRALWKYGIEIQTTTKKCVEIE